MLSDVTKMKKIKLNVPRDYHLLDGFADAKDALRDFNDLGPG